MSYVKYILFVGLAILAKSEAQVIADVVKQCLRQPSLVEHAKSVSKCYNDTFIAKIITNTTGLDCKNFDDYNKTYRDFYEHVLELCNNGTTANLTRAQTTFLEILEFAMNNDKTKEYIEKRTISSCLEKVSKEIEECNKSNLTEYDATYNALVWIRRTTLTFDAYTCDNMNSSSICTTEIINNTCGPELADYTQSMYNIALKMCETPAEPNSSSYLSPVSHLFFILTAVILKSQ